jgi:hypothetical protein
MHLDLVESQPNAFKMTAKNANTHAYGDVHLVMLAHLRRRWRLSGRDGIQRFCGSETPIFHCAGHEETETKGSRWGDWTLD